MWKLIAGMKISVDGKMEGPEHGADWVEAWSEDYGLTPQVNACVVFTENSIQPINLTLTFSAFYRLLRSLLVPRLVLVMENLLCAEVHNSTCGTQIELT